jgi:hypothetical protein
LVKNGSTPRALEESKPFYMERSEGEKQLLAPHFRGVGALPKEVLDTYEHFCKSGQVLD